MSFVLPWIGAGVVIGLIAYGLVPALIDPARRERRLARRVLGQHAADYLTSRELYRRAHDRRTP